MAITMMILITSSNNREENESVVKGMIILMIIQVIRIMIMAQVIISMKYTMLALRIDWYKSVQVFHLHIYCALSWFPKTPITI